MTYFDYNKLLNSSNLLETTLIMEDIAFHKIAHNSWSEQFPYSPNVIFRMAHNGKEIFLRFDVEERYTMAQVTEDNGEVWNDSCVEFFIAFDKSGYYNLEFTCIGKVLLGFHKDRSNGERAGENIMQNIKRFSSLGTKNFEEIEGSNRWTLTTAIPITTFFKHNIPTISGIEAAANLYKCGNKLMKPHYLSWKKVNTPAPDFHRPEFFSEIKFNREIAFL